MVNETVVTRTTSSSDWHDDVIKWKHFPRNWPFVRKIHRSPVNFQHKGQWRGALMFSLIYVWINDWANNREAGDLRRQHGHYDVIVMNTAGTKHNDNVIIKMHLSWSFHRTDLRTLGKRYSVLSGFSTIHCDFVNNVLINSYWFKAWSVGCCKWGQEPVCHCASGRHHARDNQSHPPEACHHRIRQNDVVVLFWR